MDEETYEEFVQRRRLENRKVLKHLGIYKLSQNSKVFKAHQDSLKALNRPKDKNLKKSKPNFSCFVPTRRSSRLLGKAPQAVETCDFVDETIQLNTIKRERRENIFGEIPDVPVGTEFATRLDASHAGVHRPTVAGIHGNPALGCYSIALSGGYEDDVDNGDEFIYTGEGGRDLKGTKANPKNLRTAPQSKDQSLERGNLALSKNIENNVPVRVLRGYKLRSDFAPEEGYRYDGLYMVKDYYLTTGLSGFQVYKFRFERIKDQAPAPWCNTNNAYHSAYDEGKQSQEKDEQSEST